MNILITGGTGTVGSEVVKELLKPDRDDLNIRIMTRSPQKTDNLPKGTKGVVGDLDKIQTLNEAYEDVDKLFLITTPESEDETQSGLNAVEAAKKAGMQKIVYMSAYNLEAFNNAPHLEDKIPVEDAVRKSGITYTLLRPNGFFQNDYWFKEGILKHGVYSQPMGDIGLNRVDVRDIAEAAVRALITDDFNNSTYPLVGAEPITGGYVATLYSRYIGKSVDYNGDDLESWAEQQRRFLPERIVDDLYAMYSHFLENGYLASDEDIKKTQIILGKEPRNYEVFVRETVSQWKEAQPVE